MVDTSILIKEYNNGASLAKLSKEYNMPARTIRRILTENNIHIRSKNEQNKYSPQNQRKYSINDTFFSTQNSNMAYILGFLAADGCVYKKNNTIKIGISSIDRNFLVMLNQIMESNFPIHDYITNKGYSVSELRITSSQIKKDLAEYGIIPKKTYSLTFPTKLESKYYLDFIRGYFDGDGSISTAGKAIRWQLCCYNSELLATVVNILSEYGIPKVNIQHYKDKHLYYIQYSTIPTKEIFCVLYKENCLYLPRKYNKYKQLIMK